MSPPPEHACGTVHACRDGALGSKAEAALPRNLELASPLLRRPRYDAVDRAGGARRRRRFGVRRQSEAATPLWM